VIHIPAEIRAKLQFLVGNPDLVSNLPVKVFDEQRLGFLADLSTALLEISDTRSLPDVVTFAFWCRRANLAKIAAGSNGGRLKVGLGLVFHISPANVPVNFAFTLAFGLLAGNSCVVRLPSKESRSATVISDAIASLLLTQQHANLIPHIHIIRFGHDDQINEFWLDTADGRVVWGGDATIAHMRSLRTRSRSREVAFPDRYSLCAIEPKEVLAATKEELDHLCVQLFNDVYLMDQFACSSPQLLSWIGQEGEIEEAKGRLWAAFVKHIKSRYSMEPIHVMDKFVAACSNILSNANVEHVERHDNLLYRVELSALSFRQQEQRGYFGTVHEVSLQNLAQLAPIIDDRFQTLTYYGFDREQLERFVVENRLRGVDRIVPVGKALDMGIIWDGYDIISNLSRIVDIQ
jgi:hypothetical protein